MLKFSFTLSKMTVLLNQAKRHSTLFQRWRCPWNKRSGTQHYFKDDDVLETSAAALGTFPKLTGSLNQAQLHSALFQKMTGSLKQAQRHSALFQSWRCPWNKCSSTQHFFRDMCEVSLKQAKGHHGMYSKVDVGPPLELAWHPLAFWRVDPWLPIYLWILVKDGFCLFNWVKRVQNKGWFLQLLKT